MKKTATREEVELVLGKHRHISLTQAVRDAILNHLFKEPYEPKVGEWVLTSDNADGWGSSIEDVNNKILQIESIDSDGYVKFENGLVTNVTEIERPATEDEIKRAQWKEGEVYEVWDNEIDVEKRLRYSSNLYGFFYVYDKNDKQRDKWDNFKRVVQC